MIMPQGHYPGATKDLTRLARTRFVLRRIEQLRDELGEDLSIWQVAAGCGFCRTMAKKHLANLERWGYLQTYQRRVSRTNPIYVRLLRGN